MTHTTQLPDSAGEFSDYKLCDGLCPKCGSHQLRFKVWESSCGGYEDYKYNCINCNHHWWIDGPDA